MKKEKQLRKIPIFLTGNSSEIDQTFQKYENEKSNISKYYFIIHYSKILKLDQI